MIWILLWLSVVTKYDKYDRTIPNPKADEYSSYYSSRIYQKDNYQVFKSSGELIDYVILNNIPYTAEIYCSSSLYSLALVPQKLKLEEITK